MFDKEKLKQAMDDHGDTNKALAVFLQGFGPAIGGLIPEA